MGARLYCQTLALYSNQAGTEGTLKMFGRMKKRVCAVVAAGSAFVFSQAHAAYEFVTVDSVTGDVTFTPGN